MMTKSIYEPNTYKIVLQRIRTDSDSKDSCRPFFVLFILLSQYGLSSNQTIDMKVRALELKDGHIYLDCQEMNPSYKDYIVEIPPCIHNDLLLFIDNKEPEDYVFTTNRGGKYYQQKFSSYISQLSALLNIPDLNSINLRSLANNNAFWAALSEINNEPAAPIASSVSSIPFSEVASCQKIIIESQTLSNDIAYTLYNCQLDSLVLIELQKRYSDIIEQQKRLLKYVELLKKNTACTSDVNEEKPQQ